MANLVDMKRTAADKKAEAEKWEKPYSGDDYGYGMSISLDNAALEKLGVGDLDAGETVNLVAECAITADRVETINGKKERSLTIQIHKMALSQGEATDVVGTLYGKD